MNKPEEPINPDNIVLQALKLPEFLLADLRVDVLRLDKIHPVVSGNKWFKLKYFFQDARENEHDTILTFGGAWSNHIIATSYLAKLAGFKSIGIIRGEQPQVLSQTLIDAKHYGMQLEFVTRKDYLEKNEERYRDKLVEKFGRIYLIPEGGSGSRGIRGSSEILDLIDAKDYTHILCCIGTGTMFFGLAKSSLSGPEIIGIPVLKGITLNADQFVAGEGQNDQLKIINDYHFGGYAKKTPELVAFMNNFFLKTGVPLDFVYTGKLFFAFCDLVSKKYFSAGSKILLIHSGGLQGNASLPAGTLLF